MSKKFYITISIVYAVLCAIIYFTHKTTAMHLASLLVANTVIYLVSMLSYNFLHKSLLKGNSKQFIFQVMFLLIIKLFLYALMVVGIILYLNKEVPALLIYFILMMYLIYTFIDNKFILALNRAFDKK